MDSVTERVEHRLSNSYAIQFTNGSHDEYTDIIEEAYPEPHIEVDCAEIDDYDDFLKILADKLSTNPNDYLSSHYFINDHFLRKAGTLVLYNFHELDSETTSEIAMYIKGLWEDINFDTLKEFGIAITTDDPEAVFRGNRDLSGRVLTIDLEEDDPTL